MANYQTSAKLFDRFKARHDFHAKHTTGKTIEKTSLPTEISLWNWHGPIKDQQQEGACTAFTATSLREWYENKMQKPATLVIGAPQAQYYWERETDGDVTKDNGSSIATALSVLCSYGMAPEADDVYGSSTEFQAPSAQALQDAQALRIYNWQDLGIGASGTIPADLIAAALAEGTPVAIGMDVYDSLFTPANGIVDIASAKDQNEGHAVVVLGYKQDPNKPGHRLFAFQNSWSTNYGVQLDGTTTAGFAWLTEDYVNTCVMEAGTITVEKPAGAVTPVYEVLIDLNQNPIVVNQQSTIGVKLTKDGQDVVPTVINVGLNDYWGMLPIDFPGFNGVPLSYGTPQTVKVEAHTITPYGVVKATPAELQVVDKLPPAPTPANGNFIAALLTLLKDLIMGILNIFKRK